MHLFRESRTSGHSLAMRITLKDPAPTLAHYTHPILMIITAPALPGSLLHSRFTDPTPVVAPGAYGLTEAQVSEARCVEVSSKCSAHA